MAFKMNREGFTFYTKPEGPTMKHTNQFGKPHPEKEEETFDPKDYNKDGVVDYLDKRMGPPKNNSAYAKWNNKNLENMAKQTLMNADANPFNFGSK